eukprot:6749-Prymnesium_polylepis.1
MLALVLLALPSSRMEEYELPSYAQRVLVESRAEARRPRHEHDALLHDYELSSDEEEALQPGGGLGAAASTPMLGAMREAMLSRQAGRDDATPKDGRGRHSREGKGKEKGDSYAKAAYEHRKQAEDFSMGRPCLASCPFDRSCGLHMTPAHLMRAHVQMYGTDCSMKEPAEPGGLPTYNCRRVRPCSSNSNT